MPPALQVDITATRIEGFAPLDAQLGAAQTVCVPGSLHEPIFGGAANVYAVLDANRMPALPEVIEAAELQASCLFSGESAEHGDAAPWLVRLHATDALTRHLFTDGDENDLAPWECWRARAGILIRANMPLDALRSHLRRFMRVQDSMGRPFFFRFWEPLTAPAYFSNLADRPDAIARWFRPRDGGQIEAIFAPDATGDTPGLWRIAPRNLPDVPHIPQGAFTLSQSDVQVLAQFQTDRHLREMAALLISTFPEKLADVPPAEVQTLTRRCVSRMQDYGFSQRDNLFRLLAWELFFGPNFESRDPGGDLRKICASESDETEKYALLAARMESFEQLQGSDAGLR